MNRFFILDLGSGNTCENDHKIIDRMLKEIGSIDSQRKFILKFQLFKEAGDNVPLEPDLFDYAYRQARTMGFLVTASVFDMNELEFLLMNYEVPFVKIANRPDCYHLAGEIPRKIPVVASVKDTREMIPDLMLATKLCCVSDYPADIDDYEKQFSPQDLRNGISDHTTTWQMFEAYSPTFYECHFCLEDSKGPDSGMFARRPQDLRYISRYL